MAKVMKMPKIGVNMTEGTIMEWIEDYRIEYSYDNDEKLSSIVSNYSSNHDGWYNDYKSKTEYTYDPIGNLTLNVWCDFDVSSNDWFESGKNEMENLMAVSVMLPHWMELTGKNMKIIRLWFPVHPEYWTMALLEGIVYSSLTILIIYGILLGPINQKYRLAMLPHRMVSPGQNMLTIQY